MRMIVLHRLNNRDGMPRESRASPVRLQFVSRLRFGFLECHVVSRFGVYIGLN
jgi:hypothetical protein